MWYQSVFLEGYFDIEIVSYAVVSFSSHTFTLFHRYLLLQSWPFFCYSIKVRLFPSTDYHSPFNTS
jgi:hypothetical protein